MKPKPLPGDYTLALAAYNHVVIQLSAIGISASPTPPYLSLANTTRTTSLLSPILLRYQGSQFVVRFDANCYIHLTHKMDRHDLPRDRIPIVSNLDSTTSTTIPFSPALQPSAIARILSRLPPRALIIVIETNDLFTTEPCELASHIVEAELVIIPSPDGRDGVWWGS